MHSRPGGGTLTGNRVFGNKLDGLLVRDGAEPAISDNEVTRNGGWGAELKVSPAACLPGCFCARAASALTLCTRCSASIMMQY